MSKTLREYTTGFYCCFFTSLEESSRNPVQETSPGSDFPVGLRSGRQVPGTEPRAGVKQGVSEVPLSDCKSHRAAVEPTGNFPEPQISPRTHNMGQSPPEHSICYHSLSRRDTTAGTTQPRSSTHNGEFFPSSHDTRNGSLSRQCCTQQQFNIGG